MNQSVLSLSLTGILLFTIQAIPVTAESSTITTMSTTESPTDPVVIFGGVGIGLSLFVSRCR